MSDEGHWYVRGQIFCNGNERAELVATGLRSEGSKRKGLKILRRDSVVRFTRKVPGAHAGDPMSAAFFVQQMVWDLWPDNVRRPASRFTVSVDWIPGDPPTLDHQRT